ncbi:MAG: GAF domain-containing protein [Firmicutes bacterium]|nr:GAF domain-containing protein [Bacillota bacterium]MBR6236822.1 GAF domain-containing protein [Bacillota bacterium]
MSNYTRKNIIACMGDSITFGHGVSATRERDAWTFVLQRMLADRAKVLNFGINGASASEGCPESYRASGLLDEALGCGADACILMLGTNDTKERIWNTQAYKMGMRGIISDVLRKTSSTQPPELFLMIPPAVFPMEDGQTAYGVSAEILTGQVIPIVEKLAEDYCLPLIDLYTATKDHPEYYLEGVHPNAAGNLAIAQQVYADIIEWLEAPKEGPKNMTDYKSLTMSVKAVTSECPHLIANLANTAALIWEYMDDINWAGFYLVQDGKLVLGPFQGKMACTEIEIGSGVCGTAVAQEKTQLVPNVHEFSGHIACDSASNSEIVVPLRKDGEVFGVLDIDSPSFGRFTEEDKDHLEYLAGLLELNLFKE